MKKLFSVLLVLVLVLSLCGCGGKDKPLSGLFYLTEMTVDGESMNYTDLTLVEITDSYIKFNGDGTGELYITEMGVESFSADEEAGTITLDSDGSEMTYSRSGNVLTVDIDTASGTAFIFSREGSIDLRNAQESVAIPMDAEAEEFWLGGWYGRWTVFSGDGYYADMIGGSLDCCAYIEPNAEQEGTYLITIWDENYNDYYDNPLASVVVRNDPSQGYSEYGTLISADDEGSFFYGEVEKGDWVIDPEYAGFDDMLIIEGSYTDDEDEYCEYGVVLTKWGYEWNYDATVPPYYYYDYFLSLMDYGEEVPFIFDPFA